VLAGVLRQLLCIFRQNPWPKVTTTGREPTDGPRLDYDVNAPDGSLIEVRNVALD
jgi:hypothetical protein